jgi:hypothetical protein
VRSSSDRMLSVSNASVRFFRSIFISNLFRFSNIRTGLFFKLSVAVRLQCGRLTMRTAR